MIIREDFLWTEKYRPRKVADVILPPDMKAMFQGYVDQGNIPNLILAGGAGMGKTTVALAALAELNCDVLLINGSKDRGIDTLRNEIQNFASTVSFKAKRKYVVIDEADGLGAATQNGLKSFMETYSKNCGFILTCNTPGSIITPLHSRCPVVQFKIKKGDIPKLALQFMKRVESILTEEKVEYDKAVLAEFIKKFFPDWRRCLNEIQRYSSTGKIDSGILANLEEISLQELLEFMKKKELSKVRKWVAENLDQDQATIFRKFYDKAVDYFTPSYIAQLILTIADYQFKAAFAVDQEINLAAFLATVMVDAEWKS